jgi:hypothetical protein
LNVHGVNYVRQSEIHTAKQLVPEPSATGAEMASENIIFAKEVHRKFLSECKFCEPRHSEIPYFLEDNSEF